MRRFFVLLFLLMFITSPVSKSEEIPVRLHVIAENNTKVAQEIKMKVKDAVFKTATEITKEADNAQEAYAMLFASVGVIRRNARDAAVKAGFEGEIEAVVTRENFPARLYGDMIVKEGEYPTVLVRIGSAEGKNWWCVIYPDLCLYGEKTETNDIQFYSKFAYWFKKIINGWSV